MLLVERFIELLWQILLAVVEFKVTTWCIDSIRKEFAITDFFSSVYVCVASLCVLLSILLHAR
jgi:hypothetical protein